MQGWMARTRAWSPAQGPPAAPQQIAPRIDRVQGDGGTGGSSGRLWVPSEGPVRSDPGGPGGEPDGRTLVRTGHSPLDE